MGVGEDEEEYEEEDTLKRLFYFKGQRAVEVEGGF